MGDKSSPKHDPENVSFGFIMADSDAELRAQCFECAEILPQSSLFFSCYTFFLNYLVRWSSEIF